MKILNSFKSFLTLLLFSLLFLSGTAIAQDEDSDDDSKDVDIPFVDRDGDGINDLLQHGWGLRFLKRYQKRQLIWDQLNIDVVKGEDGKRMVDTDGDGIGDINFKDYMKEHMNELIDTDGDGIGDTTLKDYLGRRFQSFDRDGDGIPDDMSKEEMRAAFAEMKKWREQLRERLRNGQVPFIDENGDGIPDNLPDMLQGRRRRSR